MGVLEILRIERHKIVNCKIVFIFLQIILFPLNLQYIWREINKPTSQNLKANDQAQ
jgi:hypothetical protein